MISLLAQQLMLGSAKATAQVSLDAAAWAPLAARGFVTVRPSGARFDPAVIVTITPAGRAAQLASELHSQP